MNNIWWKNEEQPSFGERYSVDFDKVSTPGILLWKSKISIFFINSLLNLKILLVVYFPKIWVFKPHVRMFPKYFLDWKSLQNGFSDAFSRFLWNVCFLKIIFLLVMTVHRCDRWAKRTTKGSIRGTLGCTAFISEYQSIISLPKLKKHFGWHTYIIISNITSVYLSFHRLLPYRRLLNASIVNPWYHFFLVAARAHF